MTIGKDSSITGTVTGKKPEEIVIFEACNTLASITTKGNLGAAIAGLVRTYSPHDLTRMKINFSHKIDSFTPEYKKELKKTIASFLDGTYQTIRLMNQQAALLPCRNQSGIVHNNIGRWLPDSAPVVIIRETASGF